MDHDSDMDDSKLIKKLFNNRSLKHHCTQVYSQSTVLLDLGTTSMLQAYWLTAADEVNSFDQTIPISDTWHFLIPDTFEADWSVP